MSAELPNIGAGADLATSDRKRVILATNLVLREDLVPWVIDLVSQIKTEGRYYIIEHRSFDEARPFGWATVVQTSPGDEIVWALRNGRNAFSRCVKNRSARPTFTVWCVLKQDDKEDFYHLRVADFGKSVAPEVEDLQRLERTSRGREAAVEIMKRPDFRGYWKSRAFLFDRTDVRKDEEVLSDKEYWKRYGKGKESQSSKDTVVDLPSPEDVRDFAHKDNREQVLS